MVRFIVVAWLLSASLLLSGGCQPSRPPVKHVDATIEVAPVSDALFPVRAKGKSGYIDATGKIVIEPQFDGAWEFSEGRAVVAMHSENGSFLLGIIDRAGKLIVPCESESGREVHGYSEGLIAWDRDGRTGFLDIDGNWVIEPRFYYEEIHEDMCGCQAEGWPVHDFSGGFAFVQEGRRRYFIDANGERTFGRDFDEGGMFANGTAFVQVGNQFGMIDTAGEFVVALQDERPIRIDEISAVRSDDETESYYYADGTGKRAFPGDFSRASRFSEGLAFVSQPGWERDRGMDCVDRNGEIQFHLPGGYAPTAFREGMLMVTVVTTKTEGWSGGGSRSWTDTQILFLDREGRTIVELEPSILERGVRGQSAHSFSNGLARVLSNDPEGRSGYVDRKGNWVWLDVPEDRSVSPHAG